MTVATASGSSDAQALGIVPVATATSQISRPTDPSA